MLSPTAETAAASPAAPLLTDDHSFGGKLGKLFDEIWRDRDSKRLFLFTCVLALFMSVEMTYGARSNSLGLLSDAFHVAFHVLALVTSLLAMVTGRKPATFEYSYGLDRSEIVAAFTAANCLIFVCLFILVHGTHRMFFPVDLSGARVLEFGVAGLAINLTGLFMFGKRGSRTSPFPRMTDSGAPGAHQSNIQAVYLQVLSDVLSSVSVICSALLVRWQGWVFVDALQSLLVAGITLYSVIPLFKATGLVLVQARPSHLKSSLDRCRREVSAVDGVLECVDSNFWTQSPGVMVGSVRVRVRTNADEQAILVTVYRLFSRYITHLTVQIDKDDWLLPADMAPAVRL